MDKPIKLEMKGEILSEELKRGLKFFLERPNLAEVPCEPPADLKEFEDRLGELVIYLGKLFFGLTYDVGAGKTLKREKNSEVLVQALCNYEKYCQSNHSTFMDFADHYEFLKLVLERNAPLFNETYLLGVKRHRSILSVSQKNVIIVQAIAQVLWQIKKNEIPTIEKMRENLTLNTTWNKFLKLEDSQLPELKTFNQRTIENWSRKVCPIPIKFRKSHPSDKKVFEEFFNTLIPIPGIFLDDDKMINFPKLRFATICLTRILKVLGWSRDQIYTSDFIRLYQKKLRFYPCYYVRDWVYEAFVENGSISDL